MKTKILDFIDFEKVNVLLEGFNKSTGFVTAILDLEGNILSKSGWRSICTGFHRINTETAKKCRISDTVLAGKIAKGEKYYFYKCLNGLVDVAVPIVIKGEHIANLFSGQFFFEQPDNSFFIKQARQFGFNETEYLKALEEVPIIPEEKVRIIMEFLLNMTQLISDITFQQMELMELNNALQITEERYRLVQENSMDGILLTSADGAIISANQAACNLFQSSEGEMSQVRLSNLVTNNDHGLTVLFDKLNLTRKAKGELMMLRKDGKAFPVELSVSAFTDQSGILLHSLIIHDITERHETEYLLKEKNEEINAQNEEYQQMNEELIQVNEELIKAKEKAEESDRLKTAFLQNMSHEIRTPMNAIMGFSDLLVKNYNNKPKLERFSEIINQRCNDLLEIINDLLDIAKIESGRLSIDIEECDLNDLFTELTTFFKEFQQRKEKDQIAFSMKLLGNPSDYLIATDRVKLKQVLINLINNAFKFTDTGKIECICQLDGNSNLLFTVTDTGIGIPADKHQVIFDRFTQLRQNQNLAYGGTGLGLTIVKGLVEAFGGKIWLESEPGKGTTFCFTITYKKPVQKKHAPNLSEVAQAYRFTGKTILVVEDDTFNAIYIKEILSLTDINVLYTPWGLEAVEVSSKQHPDLVLMDIRLPDINGYEVTRRIKQINPEIKVIAQTAYAGQEDKKKCMDAGCCDYINKPLKSDLLLFLINKYVM